MCDEWCLSEASLKLRRHLRNWVSEHRGKNSIGKKLLALSYVQKRQKRSYNGYNSCAHEKGPIFDSDLFSAVLISNHKFILMETFQYIIDSLVIMYTGTCLEDLWKDVKALYR